MTSTLHEHNVDELTFTVDETHEDTPCVQIQTACPNQAVVLINWNHSHFPGPRAYCLGHFDGYRRIGGRQSPPVPLAAFCPKCNRDLIAHTWSPVR